MKNGGSFHSKKQDLSLTASSAVKKQVAAPDNKGPMGAISGTAALSHFNWDHRPSDPGWQISAVSGWTCQWVFFCCCCCCCCPKMCWFTLIFIEDVGVKLCIVPKIGSKDWTNLCGKEFWSIPTVAALYSISAAQFTLSFPMFFLLDPSRSPSLLVFAGESTLWSLVLNCSLLENPWWRCWWEIHQTISADFKKATFDETRGYPFKLPLVVAWI